MNKDRKHEKMLDVLSGIEDAILEKQLTRRFSLWDKRGRRNRKPLIAALASAAGLAFAVLGVLLIIGQRNVPIYQGMTVHNASPQVASLPSEAVSLSAGNGSFVMASHLSTGRSLTAMPLGTTMPGGTGAETVLPPHDNGNHNGHNKEEAEELPMFGETYYAMPGEDIYIHIHISNPRGYEILSFTLNGVKYTSYMFEPGSDTETLILKYNVGETSGLQEYTIDAIKYVDGERIKDVRMKGDKTVKVYVNGTGSAEDTLYFDASLTVDTLTAIPVWSESFTGDKTLLTLGLYEDDVCIRELSPEDTVVKNLPLGKRLVLKATYQNGDRTETAAYVFETPQASDVWIVDGVIRGLGTCSDTVLILDAPIGDNAFEGAGIKEVYMTERVTEIGQKAFFMCTKLEEVHLPNGLTAIPPSAFLHCESLKIIEIPETVQTIGGGAFTNCLDLQSITIPASVKQLGPECFENCFSLAEVNGMEGVTTLREAAFWNCGSLKSITLPMGITAIPEYLFYGCESLAEITIPQTVKTIGDSAFYQTALRSIVIPDRVTSLGAHAFADCKKLETITLPDSITEIGTLAFRDCHALKTVELPKNLKILSNHVFSGCKALQTVTLPSGLTVIEDYAFSNCESLSRIAIPNSIQSIGQSVFSGCEALRQITLPDVAFEIQVGAFSSCAYFLDENNWENGILYIGNHLIAADPSVTKCTVREGTVTIAVHAFNFCEQLEEVQLPESLRVIGGMAFSYCSSLQSITLSENLTKIAYDAFFDSPITVTYGGTEAQWRAIKEKDYNTHEYTVICRDGTFLWNGKV